MQNHVAAMFIGEYEMKLFKIATPSLVLRDYTAAPITFISTIVEAVPLPPLPTPTAPSSNPDAAALGDKVDAAL
jgi:hypothetical protein